MSFYLDNENRTYITSEHDWDYRNGADGSTLLRLKLSGFNKLPKTLEIRKFLSWERNTYVPSIFTETRYCGAIAFRSVWGWTSGYEIIFFTDTDDFDNAKNNPFPSEPTKGWKTKRTIINRV